MPALMGEVPYVFSKLAAHKEEAGKQKNSHPCWLLLAAFGEDIEGRDELSKELPGVQVGMKGNRIQKSWAFQG